MQAFEGAHMRTGPAGLAKFLPALLCILVTLDANSAVASTPQNPQLTPRVLKEGADSVGFTAALSRVYLNIGEYWEEWTRHFNPLVGLERQSPIQVRDAQRLSPHWNWSEGHAPAHAR